MNYGKHGRYPHAAIGNECIRNINAAKETYERSIASDCKDNPKCVSSKRTVKEGIAQLREPEGELIWNDMENVTEYCFSQCVYQEKGNIPTNILFTPNISEPMANFVITKQNVASKLSKLKENKSGGPDNVRGQRSVLTTLRRPRCMDGSAATQWRKANITTVYKKADRKISGNYRRIGLTSVISKLTGIIY